MANFIEFTTQHHERTFGSPVHNGKRPKSFREIDGVRVDGEPVRFIDPTISDRLGRYFIEARKLRRRKIANDCVAFVALMNSIELKDSTHNPFTHFDRDRPVTGISEVPVVLTNRLHRGFSVPTHIILPAHLERGENYLQKLGDKGPLCMANLETSMRIMGSTGAYPADRF